MEFKILTDSCCNLPDEMIDDMGIEIFPLTFIVDDKQYQSYLKGTKTNLAEFYEMMRDGKVITTSLPNLAEADKLIREQLDQGYDVIYLGFSSALSGTFNAIETRLSEISNDYPDRKICAVDTLAASLGQGLLVYYANKLKQDGASIEEVAEWVEANKLKLAHWFTVEDLMFLYRGGRVSRTSAWAGTLLNIKPVLHVNDEGHLIPLSKTRGRKKSIDALIDHMDQTADKPLSDQPIFIAHGDCIKDAQYMADKIKERFGVEDILINYIDPVIGAHSGPGTLALFFMASER